MATRADWAKRVARWQASGQSAKAFAAQERIDAKQLGWWRWRLRSSPLPAAESAPHFMAVHVVEEPSRRTSEGGLVEIALSNGRVVRVAPGFDASTLQRVLTIASEEGDAC